MLKSPFTPINAKPKTQTPNSRKRRKGRESVGKLTIREIVERKDGYSRKTFLVQADGTAEGGHGRKKFKTLVEAEAFTDLKSVELTNAQTTLNSIITRLSKSQVQDAESAFNRLGVRYSLAQAGEYFLRHFVPPVNPVCLTDALDNFLEARRHEESDLSR
ncbi:MAG: hypothetical protein ABJF10_05810 [Chthoniobacter sp.]|uniref:hypothetical protein n=1 Tax=Chthoniobacter sp. TaxID=2510640 RepID=UPI0032A52725